MSSVIAPGLPRPRNAEGVPVPWNAAAPDELGQRSSKRTRRTAGGWICQVCGLRLDPAVPVVLFASADESVAAVPGEHLPMEPTLIGVHAMDHGLLHRPCARLALAHCPGLRDARSKGELVALMVMPGSIEHFGTEALFLDVATLEAG